jgi:hypothetical protein
MKRKVLAYFRHRFAAPKHVKGENLIEFVFLQSIIPYRESKEPIKDSAFVFVVVYSLYRVSAWSAFKLSLRNGHYRVRYLEMPSQMREPGI